MEKFYKVNEITLHVIEEGPSDGNLIIFLHGFPEFWYSWKNQLPYFSKLGYKVLAPDQRGYNLSDKPASVKDFTLKELVQDVVELIAATGKEKAYVIGHDLGGIVAWKLAEQHPELVYKLIIINIPHPKVFIRTLKNSLRQKIISSYTFFAQIPWLPEKILSITDYEILIKSMSLSAKNGAFTNHDLKEYKKSWEEKGSMKAMINWYRAARYNRESTDNVKIKVPVLLIWANNEKFFVEQVVKESLEMCENAVLKRLDGTHWLHHEKPEEVNKIIEEFISNNNK